MDILQNIWTLMLSMYVCADIVSRKTNSELFLTIHVCLPNHFTFIRQNKQKQNITFHHPLRNKYEWVRKSLQNSFTKSCWMSNIWNSIWTFVKSDISFFFFSVKALLNLILEWKKGRKFTIHCQGHGELKIYRLTARKCSIWVSM